MCVHMFKECENTSFHKRQIAFILKAYNSGFIDRFSLISRVNRLLKCSSYKVCVWEKKMDF